MNIALIWNDINEKWGMLSKGSRYWLSAMAIFVLATPLTAIFNPSTFGVTVIMIGLGVGFFIIRPLLVQSLPKNEVLRVPDVMLLAFILDGAIFLVEMLSVTAITDWKVMASAALSCFAAFFVIDNKSVSLVRQVVIWSIVLIAFVMQLSVAGMGSFVFFVLCAWINYWAYISGRRSLMGAASGNIRWW